MLAPVRAFLEHLIDYAGMFPPARLSMPEALRQYIHLASTPDSWILGRFVCPASQLGDLRSQADAAGVSPAPNVAALGRGGRDKDEFAVNLDADLNAIDHYRMKGGPGTVDAIELPLPSPTAVPIDDLVNYLQTRLRLFGLRAFIEAPLIASWDSDIVSLCSFLRRLNDSASSDIPTLSLKIRCGGATPTAIPSTEQIAFFIHRCREARLPWKATAGLHHPMRHQEATLQTMTHGFLNVFAAGILAHVHPLDENQLADVLREESAAAFRFTADRFAWRNWECTVDQIRAARRWMPSFGSCSFDEPRDDLRALGLIAPTAMA